MNHQPPPLIAVPLDLSDEAAAKLLDFLYEFAHRLESHYSEQLYRYHNAIDERQADLWSPDGYSARVEVTRKETIRTGSEARVFCRR